MSIQIHMPLLGMFSSLQCLNVINYNHIIVCVCHTELNGYLLSDLPIITVALNHVLQ